MSNTDLDRLLSNNLQWSQKKSASDKSFFPTSVDGQSPTYLWIGCVDSRVPVEVICGLEPGEMLTHRNVANQFLEDDVNANAIIEFGVGVLKIPNIVVCGHTACGGVKAGIAQAQTQVSDSSHLSRWVSPIADLYERHKEALAEQSASDQANGLAVKNVESQINRLCETPTVKAAWAAEQPLAVHGLLYDLASGTLKDLGLSRYGQ